MSQENQNEDMGDPEVVTEATELGWVPLDKFKGDPDKWVDAESFVERGKHIMPILRKNNERLRQDLLRRDTEIGTLQQNLKGMGQSLQRLEGAYNDGLQRALKEQKADLRKQLIEARKDDDVDLEVALQDKIDEVTAAEGQATADAARQVSTGPAPTAPGLSPEFVAWQTANPWFGEDKKKTKAVLRAAEDMRDEGDTAVGGDFFDRAVARAFEEEPAPPSKVEQGNARGTSTGGGSRGKGFSSLPKEAQDICMQDEETFVGPNKKFKDVKSWQTYYAKVYNGEPV